MSQTTVKSALIRCPVRLFSGNAAMIISACSELRSTRTRLLFGVPSAFLDTEATVTGSQSSPRTEAHFTNWRSVVSSYLTVATSTLRKRVLR